MKNLIFLYRLEVKQKSPSIEKRSEKIGQVFSLELSEREQNGSDAKNASKPKPAHLTQSRKRRVEVRSEECCAKGSISDCTGSGGLGGGSVPCVNFQGKKVIIGKALHPVLQEQIIVFYSI
jgi:hypothetical protein